MSAPGDTTGTEPLAGDPARQAVDSLLGYDYQIWRTVEIWFQLEPGQVLYIECAEDFDVVTSKAATTNQVKNSPKNITLASSDVREAIVNHWTAVEKNPHRLVRMRFLTRGDIGLERDRPFGAEPGLLVWRRAAAGDGEADQAITDYLMRHLDDASMKQFLAASTPDARRLKLYGAIEWVVREPPLDAVRLAIRRAAIERGNARGVMSQVSARAVTGLLEHCRAVAVAPDPAQRSLTSEDLQLVFEEHTSIPLPQTHAVAGLLTQALVQATPGHAPVAIFPFSDLGELPPLPSVVMPRAHFCDQVLDAMSAGPVLIVGSEGKGKSIVGNLVARTELARAHWAELANDPQRVCFELERLVLLVRSTTKPSLIVLDDVPAALGVDRDVWTRLHALIQSCRVLSVRLLMTAKGVPQDQVDSRFRAEGVKVLAVPALTEPEVESFFEALGCPAELRELWARSTLAQTGNGHPKLVHLRGLELRDAAWPPPTASALLHAPTSILEARGNARQTVARTVPEPDKTFLYALSLSVLPFSREDAIRVGEALRIPAPGDVFDRLSGRWIEARARGQYAVTTLLAGQAQLSLSEDSVIEAHRVLFDAFVFDGSIGAGDAWGLFFQALQGRDPRRLGRFITSLITADLSGVSGLADSLEILLAMAPGRALLPGFDAKTSAMFRHLQFTIAAEVRPEALADIVAQWEWAIEQIDDQPARVGLSVIRGLAISGSLEVSLPAGVMVRAIADVAEIDKLPVATPPITGGDEVVKADGQCLGLLGVLFLFHQNRSTGKEFLDETLTALEGLDATVRDRMLEAFDARFAENVSMVAKAWLAETKREQPNWDGLLTVMSRTGELARKWGAASLGCNTARIQSIVFDEVDEVRDLARAKAVLDEAGQVFGDSPVLDEQRANFAFRHDDFARAVDLWERSLDLRGDDVSKLRDPFASRRAGIAASRLGRFDLAAAFFEAGRGMVIEMEGASGPPASAFDIDASYCWYLSGNGERMLAALARAALELSGVYDRVADFDRFRAQKYCGHLAAWLTYKLGLNGDSQAKLDDPVTGAATDPARQELVATLEPTPHVVTASLIARVASRLRLSTTAVLELRRSAESSRLSSTVFMLAQLEIAEAVREHSMADFDERIVNLRQAAWQAMASARSGRIQDSTVTISDDIKAERLGFEWYFGLALTLVMFHGGELEDLIERWAARLHNAPDSSQLAREFEIARDAFEVDPSTAAARLQANVSVECLAAAAVVLRLPTRRPADTLHAQARVVVCLYAFPMIRGAVDVALASLAEVFGAHWRAHVMHPASLREPRLSVRAIQEALDFRGPPAERLLKILIAGSFASGQVVPQAAADALAKAKRLNAEAERLSARRPGAALLGPLATD